MKSIIKLLSPYLILIVFFLGAISFYTVVYSKANIIPKKSQVRSAAPVIRDTDLSLLEENTLLMSAPPRSSRDWKTFPPIAKWMSDQLGVQIKYVQASEWDGFDHDLVDEKYDIVFGGPHYVQYLNKKLNYEIIAKLPTPQQWTVITHIDSKIRKVKQLSGKNVCVQGVRNFARLVLFNEFEHQPARLPTPVEIENRETAFNKVVEGKCSATVISTIEFDTYTKKYKREMARQGRSAVKLPVVRIHTFKANPNQAFALSKTVSAKYKDKITKLLLSDEGQHKMQLLRDRWGGGKLLIAARNSEYSKVKNLLYNSPLFGNHF